MMMLQYANTSYVCVSDVVRVVNLQGRLKERKKQTSELRFDFNIDSIGKSAIYIFCNNSVFQRERENNILILGRDDWSKNVQHVPIYYVIFMYYFCVVRLLTMLHTNIRACLFYFLSSIPQQ